MGVTPFTEIFKCYPFMSCSLDIAEQYHVVAFISAVFGFFFFNMWQIQYMFTYSPKQPRDGSTAFNILCAQSALSGTSVNNTVELFSSYMVHTFTVQ